MTSLTSHVPRTQGSLGVSSLLSPPLSDMARFLLSNLVLTVLLLLMLGSEVRDAFFAPALDPCPCDNTTASSSFAEAQTGCRWSTYMIIIAGMTSAVGLGLTRVNDLGRVLILSLFAWLILYAIIPPNNNKSP